MIIYRTKCKGVISEFAFLEGTKPTKVIILCEGLPVAPKRREAIQFVAQQGYLVFYPRYLGTWESEGEFLAKSPTKDLRPLIRLIDSGIIQELFNDRVFFFNIRQISVVGTSFGGSVALESSGFKEVSKVVALSPIVNFKNFNTKFPEQDLTQLGNFMAKAFTNGYRFKSSNWSRLLAGKIIDPAKQMADPVRKKIVIIQSKDDTTVNYKPVINFADEFGIECKLSPTGGHLSFSKISKKVWDEIFGWIDKK